MLGPKISPARARNSLRHSVAPGKRQHGQWSSGRTARSVEVALKIFCILLYIRIYIYIHYIYMYIHIYNYIYIWYLIIYEYIVVFQYSAHDCFFFCIWVNDGVYICIFVRLHGSKIKPQKTQRLGHLWQNNHLSWGVPKLGPLVPWITGGPAADPPAAAVAASCELLKQIHSLEWDANESHT